MCGGDEARGAEAGEEGVEGGRRAPDSPPFMRLCVLPLPVWPYARMAPL